MKKFNFLILCVLGFVSILLGQSQKRFEGTDTYITTSLNLLKADKNIQKEDIGKAEKIYDEYARHWQNFPLSLQEQIVELSNNALKNKIQVFPQLMSFVETQNLFLQQQGLSSNYETWINLADDLLNTKKTKQFVQLYIATNLLLSEQCLYKSISATWRVSNLDFEFKDRGFVFPVLDLICTAYKDSSCIRETGGVYYPLDEKFIGSQGKLYWERMGIPGDEIHAEIADYEINIRNARYTLDSVYLFHANYFKRPVLGRLDEKLTASSQLMESSYPQFRSYQNDLYLPQIFPNVDVQGDFVQEGMQVRFGQKGKEAFLFFRDDKNLWAKVQAETFIIKENRIVSPLVRWSLYLDNDSLEHRSSEFRYDQKKREVSMIHSAAFNQKIPFINTYHQIDMYCEAVYWQLDSAILEFGLLRIPDRKGISYFKSKNIYSDPEFQTIAGTSTVNPFYLLKKAAEAYKSNVIPISYIAKFAGLDEVAARSMLLKFASEGFVIYEIKRDEVIIQDKLFHYLLVSAKKRDYDILNIESEVEGLVNARLNLETLDLKIEGVKKVLLSEKQNVYILPTAQRILFKKNRNFGFDGYLHCGSFDFYTRASLFDYADFTVNIENVDTLSFSVKGPNEQGEIVTHQVNTRLEDFSGKLHIDSALNKGGLLDFPQFPIFMSTKPSYVYYDQSFIQKGAYHRDSFYFIVHSFRLERLNNFATDSIYFKGTFKSGGIVPDMDETLVVMPDYSLGFTNKIPEEGYPLYNGKGRFFDTLSLSNAGFRGKGRLQYLNSETRSSDFLIKPKEMLCLANQFVQKERQGNPSYPFLRGSQLQQHWDVDSNIYRVYADKQILYAYIDSLRFSGVYSFSPTYSQGKGIVEFKNSTNLTSSQFNLNANDFSADTVDFRMYTPDKKGMFVQTAGYKTKVDLAIQRASFTSNAVNSKVLFPLNMYQSYMNNMDWDIAKNEISFVGGYVNEHNFAEILRQPIEKRIENSATGVEFVSLHPKQDSLRFHASRAIYRTRDSILQINEVPYIASADAYIAPHSGDIQIGVRAKMHDIENASLMLVNDSRNYTIYKAKVNIEGLNKFKAEGYYDYKANDIQAQTLFFGNIKQNSEGITFATASIDGDSNRLILNEGFDFMGNVVLRASDSLMFFDGSSKLRYSCEEEENENRLVFKSYINPNDVKIPMNSQSKNIQGRLLGSGFYTQSSGTPFFSFLSPIRSTDSPILNQEGFLSFDKMQKAYNIIDSNQSPKLNYQVDKCFASSTGHIIPNIETDDFVMQLYGTISEDIKEQNILLQTVFNVDYFFDDDLQKSMAETFSKNTSSEVAEMNTSRYLYYLSEILPHKEVQKYKQELKTYGTLTQIPEKLQKSISFSNVVFVWNSMRNAYISTAKLDIASIGKTPINKQVKGYIQLSKNRKGDVVDIYIEASRYEWYYLNYANGLLQVMSSDVDFNDKLDLIKATKRKKGNLEYTLSSQRKKNDFVSKMQNLGSIDTEGIEEEAMEEEIEENLEEEE